MQCPSCRAVYSNGLDKCPRCKTPATRPAAQPELPAAAAPAADDSYPQTASRAGAATTNVEAAEASRAAAPIDDEAKAAATPPAPARTLIEFPGAGRAARPQWRKELSERVREIQERRARDGVQEGAEVVQRRAPERAPEPAPSLNLVPQPEAPAVNPIVAAALKRLERAHQPAPPPPARSSRGGAATATAVARVAEESYKPENKPERQPLPPRQPAPVAPPVAPKPVATTPAQTLKAEVEAAQVPAEQTVEAIGREHTLAAVPAAQPKELEAKPALKPQPKRVMAEVVDEALLAKIEAEIEAEDAEAEFADDRAPLASRVAACAVDLLVVGLASSLFASIIELAAKPNWTDARIIAMTGGIVFVVMFLYLMAATALAGRTWGMSLLSLRVADADNGLSPTAKQSVGRALLYMLSLATFGLGIFYALFDPERRAAHDHLSGTIVVRD